MDSDAFSELTDIEDDDDYVAKPQKKMTKAAERAAGYRVRHALQAPRATTYTAQALFDQMVDNSIDLDPVYQRDVVWPESKQIGLIDSVLRNFYIPPIIFTVKYADDGGESKVCIDGKQRMTSILKFMSGLIPHKDPHTGEKLWFHNPPGEKPRNLLPERYRRIFANKQIVCVEYQDLSPNDEREIFQRVQLGMALTPAEKLQIVSTPRATFTRELQSVYLKDKGGLSGETLDWNQTRGGDFRCFAQAIFCMEKYPTLNNAGTHSQLEKWLALEGELSPQFCDDVRRTYKIFLDLALDENLNVAFKTPSKISPIEFIMISLLISVHKDNMSRPQLADAVRRMREDVRSVHIDIRMNNRVAKSMLDFIAAVKPDKELAGSKRKRASEAEPSSSKRTSNTATKPKSTSRPKTPGMSPRGSAPTQAPPRPTPLNLPRVPSAPTPSESANVASASTLSQPPPTTPTHMLPPTGHHDGMSALRAAKELMLQNVVGGSVKSELPSPMLASPAQSSPFPHPLMFNSQAANQIPQLTPNQLQQLSQQFSQFHPPINTLSNDPRLRTGNGDVPQSQGYGLPPQIPGGTDRVGHSDNGWGSRSGR